MFRRFFLLLLIALLPLQGVAASFMVKCAVMDAAGQMTLSAQDDGVGVMSGDMPCQTHSDESPVAGTQPDQGCCHHMAVAIPQAFPAPDANRAPGQLYPVIAVSYTDHLPDRLQRPPLAFAI
jgi:hypothetical protein